MADFEFELETLDELPDDATKALYKENNGKFRLDLNAYGEYVKAPVVSKNKELLGKVAKVKDLTTQLEKFKDFDDESIAAFQQYKEDQAKGGGKTATESELAAKYEAQFSAQKKKLEEGHVKALAERDAKIQEAETKLSRYVLDTEITSWAAKYKADPDAHKALLKLARDHYRLDEKGHVIAVDDDGDPLPEKAEEHFANKFRSANKYLFLSDETGGSGPTGGSGKANKNKTVTRAQFDAMSQPEKMAKMQAGYKVVD